MKDWYGVIHNPQRCHDDGCHPYMAHLATLPRFNDTLRLTLIDAMIGQCQSGPMHNPWWTWPYGGFLVSMDPTALDAVARKELGDRRLEVGLPSLAEEGRAP